MQPLGTISLFTDVFQKMALTDTAVRAAKPGGKLYRISGVKGLYLYV